MRCQLVCSRCRSILLYPRGATNIRCVLCNAVTSVPPPGSEKAHLICGSCRALVMYARGATSVRCYCCQTVNSTQGSIQFAHVHCGNCRRMLMYTSGAPSVKCVICHHITNINVGNAVHRPHGTTSSASTPCTSTSQTVVVENPMSVDESGKVVCNVVVGITT